MIKKLILIAATFVLLSGCAKASELTQYKVTKYSGGKVVLEMIVVKKYRSSYLKFYLVQDGREVYFSGDYVLEELKQDD
jgi:hypothetical protein